MTARVFVDTNILLYSISDQLADGAKPQRAREVLGSDACSLSVQVFQEFVNQSTRAGRPGAISRGTAWAMVRTWQRFPVVETTLALLGNAERVQSSTGYSIWDSLIVAAAVSAGCTTLYTEDMQDGRIIDGLRIVNPFRE